MVLVEAGQAGEADVGIGQVLARAERRQGVAGGLELFAGQVRPGLQPVAASQPQPVAGRLTRPPALLQQRDPFLQIALPPPGLAGEEMSLPQPAQYIRPLAAVLDVIDDPRVEVSGVGVGLVGHRLGGRLERHRNRLVPVALPPSNASKRRRNLTIAR